MDVFLTVGAKVLIMLILVATGCTLAKVGKLKDSTTSDLAWILLNVITPCLIANSFASVESGTVKPISLVLAVVSAFVSLAIPMLLTPLLYRKESVERQKVLRYGTVFSNAAFMGIPLVTAILGSEGIIFASFYIAVFNFLNFTYGYKVMGHDSKFDKKKLILNPGSIGIIIGLPLYLFNIELPNVIMEPIELLSVLNTPIAMMIIGTYIAKMTLKDFINDKAAYLCCFYRLLLVPLILIGILLIIRPEQDLIMTTVIQGSAPTAANCVLLAIMFNRDAKLASKIVAISTILSLVSLPIIMVILDFLIKL